jgi:hypothetical protein
MRVRVLFLTKQRCGCYSRASWGDVPGLCSEVESERDRDELNSTTSATTSVLPRTRSHGDSCSLIDVILGIFAVRKPGVAAGYRARPREGPRLLCASVEGRQMRRHIFYMERQLNALRSFFGFCGLLARTSFTSCVPFPLCFGGFMTSCGARFDSWMRCAPSWHGSILDFIFCDFVCSFHWLRDTLFVVIILFHMIVFLSSCVCECILSTWSVHWLPWLICTKQALTLGHLLHWEILLEETTPRLSEVPCAGSDPSASEFMWALHDYPVN